MLVDPKTKKRTRVGFRVEEGVRPNGRKRTVRVRYAKKSGEDPETCPHYLHWDDSLVQQYNTLAKVNPPLRTKNDVEAIRQAVREGIIDILVTDHAPHAIYEKELPFDEAANGLSGLDTAWGLTLSLVQEGHLSLADAHQIGRAHV